MQTLPALDRNLQSLFVGDQIRFVMRGYYLPREQESFGKIIEIDKWGGIRVQMVSVYRHFTSKGRPAEQSTEIYFVHHTYDTELKARVYRVNVAEHSLYIEKVES